MTNHTATATATPSTATPAIDAPAIDAPAAGGPGDPRPGFAKAVALAGAVLAAVQPEQHDLPTPCTEFDVRALMGHLEMVLRRVAAIGRDEDPFSVTEHDAERTGDVLRAWTTAAEAAEAAWTDPAVLDQPRRLPWAVLPGRVALMIYTSEVTVHTWDLASATGQHPAWDDAVVAAALAAMRVALPEAERPEEVPFAGAVPVSTDAPGIDRLVAWTGRRP